MTRGARWAWLVWGTSLTLTVTWLALEVAREQPTDAGDNVFVVATVLAYGTIGALITSRRSGNRVGLIFTTIAAAGAVSGASGAYASFAIERDLPLVAGAAWISRVTFLGVLGPLAFLFLLFPTGTPPTRRWGWVLRTMLVAFGVNVVFYAFTPGPIDAGFAELSGRVPNPLGLPVAWRELVVTVTQLAGVVVLGGAIVSVVSLIQRFRRAEPDERQQIRWLAFLAVGLAVLLLIGIGLEALGLVSGPVSDAMFYALAIGLFLGIPIACAVGILRYRLYELDVVVKKTVQYGILLVASFTLIGAVVLLPGIVFVGFDERIVPGIAIGALLVAVLTILRLPARRLADRLVYGKRSTPYEVLSAFAERIGGTISTEDVLPRMAQLLGEATGAKAARVWLRVGEELRAEAAWPPDASLPSPRYTIDDELPDFDEDEVFEVRHQGELLGALTVAVAPADPMNPTKEKLARDMAAQAGLVLRNVRLIEDLRESRRRIVSAQDERAKKLERDIHDGAQQQLVALAVKQRLAASLVGKDEEQLRSMLEALQSETNQALEDLRNLARGIYPPLLADRGLAAALEGQARKSTVPVHVDSDGVGRYSQEVEAAVYFCCLEALQNVAKYAHANTITVRLLQKNGELMFEISDDGRGFDPGSTSFGTGLQGMADRIEAIGGALRIESEPGTGTTVRGRIPVRALEGSPR